MKKSFITLEPECLMLEQITEGEPFYMIRSLRGEVVKLLAL